MTTLTSPRVRPHAAIEALKRLAVTKSIQLPQPLIGALFEIGMKGEADVSSADWALIDFADVILEGPRQIEGR